METQPQYCVGWHVQTQPQHYGAWGLVQAHQRRWFYFACKRLLDILIAASALIILAPLMLLIAILVKLDSPGPAIFEQERVGARRRTGGQREHWEISAFTFYKFRSMREDADSDLHRAFVQAFIHNDHKSMAAVQRTSKDAASEPQRVFVQAFTRDDAQCEDVQVRKLINDPRVTRLGGFLRKSSLDELPQLWNVLKGDISLVGPRPPIPYEVEEYEPWHRWRLETKPGLTGLWQVTARSSADFDEMVRLDIEYIKHQSFCLDLDILLKTPLAVWRGKGAV